VAVQPDGKIVVVGQADRDLPSSASTPTDRSTTFGTDGKTTVDLGGRESANAVTVLPDGKLLVVGSREGDFLLARFTADGKLDTAFDRAGFVTTDIGSGDEAARAVLVKTTASSWRATATATSRWCATGSMAVSMRHSAAAVV
jgi:uncharacterized delta-60 repeat protein